nr:hypothetical protein [Rubripirellula sp.]
MADAFRLTFNRDRTRFYPLLEEVTAWKFQVCYCRGGHEASDSVLSACSATECMFSD